MTAIEITGKQLLELCYEEDDGIFFFDGFIVSDWPTDGPVRYPCEISHIEWHEDGELLYATKEFEATMRLDETIRVVIYKQIDSLDEILIDN